MSTSTPPTKIRSRLGAAVRRTSSVLSLTRSTTPGVSSSPKPTGRDRSASVASDSSSISRPSLDTSAQPSQPASTPSVIPSPIPESPAREDAANAEEVHDGLRGSKTGPTPLAQVIAAPTEPETAEAPTEPETAEASTEPETAEASTEPETAETVESDTSAPAIIGSANGPDTFTEEPDEIPLGSSKPTESAGDFPRDIPDAPTKGIEAVTQQTTASPNLEAAPSYFEIPVQPPAKPLTDSALQNEIVENTIGTIEDGEAGVSLDQTTPRPHGPADTENANVFYAFSEVLEVAPTPAQAGADNGLNTELAAPAAILPASDPIPIARKPEPEPKGIDFVQMPAPEVPPVEPVPEEDNVDVAQMPTPQVFLEQNPKQENAETPIVSPPIIPYDTGSIQEAWASESDMKNKDTLGRQLASSSVQTLQDPFADPVPPISISTSGPSMMMPEPGNTAVASILAPQNPPEIMVMPVQDAVPRSIDIIAGHGVESFHQHPTDETQPLLGSHQASSYLRGGSSHVAPHLNVSGMSSNTSSAQSHAKPPASHSATPRLHHLGWIEYALPDATVYYSHPTLRVTTDVDIRSITKLDAVTAYLDHRRLHDGAGIPPGFELWLREGDPVDGKGMRKKRGLGKTREFVPIRSWVDHKKRIVTSDPIWDAQGDGSGSRHHGGKAIEDSLDMEYRYWMFLENHPAHILVSQNARTDAMDVLTWSWTDRLLPSQKDIAPPFSQAECQELNNLLRSFESTGDSGIQAVLHTRIISRILMRQIQWRQANFRPYKPLPQDVLKGKVPKLQQTSPLRTFLDVMVSVIFLGVPYLFLSRINPPSSLHRLDEESGIFGPRSAGPMLLLGGCTCLVAAITLSASVTFLSLPGLDGPTRIPGFVAVLLATFSMVSSVVALFRYKSDLECVSNVGPWTGFGGEGLVLHSKRIVVLSLPLALLGYSIISFVVGLVLYSFFGVSEIPVNILQKHFEEYTRWTVVGVVGGLTGVFVHLYPPFA